MSVQSIKLTQSGPARIGLLALTAVAVTLVVFSGALMELTTRWRRQEEYSHGYLIPVVAAWLLWTRREALRESIGRPSWAGLALIVLALAMHVLGELSAIFILSQLGFIVVLLGIVLAAGGYPLLRVTFIPIIFLLFAIPLPYFIEANLTLQLQLISSRLGAFFIHSLGIPVYLEGNVIDLGNYKMQVVEACSGLRYLFPLLSLGFLAAYLFRAPWWQRALVFLSAVPITIVMNSMRIALTGVTMDRWGARMAEGVLHYFEGWIIFMACAGILIIEIYVLARFSGRSLAQVFDVPQIKPSFPGARHLAAPNLLALTVCLIALGAGGLGLSLITHRNEILPERARFAAFPVTIGPWQGYPAMLDVDTEKGLALDDYILSNYSRSDGNPVNFYVAYYASQRTGLSPHSPSVCLPGGGWLITKFERITYGTGNSAIPINRVIIEQDRAKQLVYYWFDERGRKMADEWWAKWYLLADAITMNRTDGALVRLTTIIRPGEREQDADQRLRAFMGEVIPRLSTYLPAGASMPAEAALHTPSGN
jgi:exosortase D (VPLPA-CTERM-specific)